MYNHRAVVHWATLVGIVLGFLFIVMMVAFFITALVYLTKQIFAMSMLGLL